MTPTDMLKKHIEDIQRQLDLGQFSGFTPEQTRVRLEHKAALLNAKTHAIEALHHMTKEAPVADLLEDLRALRDTAGLMWAHRYDYGDTLEDAVPGADAEPDEPGYSIIYPVAVDLGHLAQLHTHLDTIVRELERLS